MSASAALGSGGALSGRQRPPVDQAAAQALIPLRPLTLGEIMDTAFFVVQREPATMIALPLGVCALFAAGGLGIVGFCTRFISDPGDDVWLILIVVGFGLLMLLTLGPALAWLTGVISRVALRTALGPGFAPAFSSVSPRSSRHLFWPMVLFWLLSSLVAGVWGQVTNLAFSAVSLPISLLDSEVSTLVMVPVSLVWLLVWSWGLAYLMTGLPVFAAESAQTPGWIGKPHQTVNAATAVIRSITLIGLRQSLRSTLLLAATQVITTLLTSAALLGMLVVVQLYSSALGGDSVIALIEDPWVVAIALIVAFFAALALSLAYGVSAQTVLYLDLRMRREGLDLAMRFDFVATDRPPPNGALPNYPPPPPLPARPGWR